MRRSLTGALLLFAAFGAAACGSGSTRTTVARSTTTVTPTPVANAGDLCHKFTDTMLAVARERRSDADAEHQYRALAAGGRTIDAQTSNDIVSLADAFDAVNPGGYSARVSTATSTVLARCKALGYPLSNAQVLELRQLLISHFSAPTTTTTVKP